MHTYTRIHTVVQCCVFDLINYWQYKLRWTGFFLSLFVLLTRYVVAFFLIILYCFFFFLLPFSHILRYNNLIYTLKKKIKVNIWKKVYDFIAADSTLRTRQVQCRRRRPVVPSYIVCSVVPMVRSDGFFRRCRFSSQFRLIFDIINQNLLLFTFTPHAKLLVRPNSLPVFVRVGRQSNRLPSPHCRVLYVYIFFINHVSDNTNSITTHTGGTGIIRFQYKSFDAVRRRRRSRRPCLYSPPI